MSEATTDTRKAIVKLRDELVLIPDGKELAVGILTDWDALEAERDRGPIGAVPTDEGGPGKEETYWLRRKLDASIQHLRDIEDYYRLRGGTPESFNAVRAERARDLYEHILADFVNGKLTEPTRYDALEAERDRAVELVRRFRQWDDLPGRADGPFWMQEADALLAALVEDSGRG